MGCLVCGGEDVYSRGLCQPHYRRFMDRQKKIAAEQGEKAAEQFEADCLAKGWVKPKTKGGRPREEDPFDIIAAEIREKYEAKTLDNPEFKEIVSDGDRVIKKAATTRKKNGGGKSNGKTGTK